MRMFTRDKTIIRVFSKKRKSSKYEAFMKRHYPRVYKFFIQSISRGECPLCGFHLKSSATLGPHTKSMNCRMRWSMIANKMFGRKRLSEDDIIEIINKIREENGLPPMPH